MPTPDASKLLDWSNYLYGLAAMLTLIATFGVIYFGRTVSSIKDAQLKRYQIEADLKIAQANESAASALQRVAEANAKAADAQAKAGDATVRIASAEATAANAKAAAAAANAEAERSKTERARLEARVLELSNTNAQQHQRIAQLEDNARPRTVSASQHDAIVKALKTLGQQTVDVRIYAHEGEALTFADQVERALRDSGLTVNGTQVLDGNGTGFGFAISPETTQIPQAVIAIINAFGAAGIRLDVFQTDLAKSGPFLMIGSKPNTIVR